MAEERGPWLERLHARDPEILEGVWAEHLGPLTRYLHGMLRHPADAEDLAREALLKFTEGVERFRGEASPRTFLFQIAHNIALNHLSSAASRRETFPGELPERRDPAESPAEKLLRREEGDRLRTLLRGLPPQQRAVVILRTWEELSFREIASVLGIAEGTAKAHYFFALRNLRRYMEPPHECP